MYLGSVEAACARDDLLHAGVTHVLDISRRECTKCRDFEYLTITVHDHPDANIHQHLDVCAGFIHTALKRGSVLVHCKFGRSRSASAVVAYLMKHHNMSCRESISLCVERRPMVRPNSGFLRQLKQYEVDLSETAM